MRNAFLETAEDLQWLRETHLRGVPLPAKYAQFSFAVMAGNEDAPYSVNLYVSPAPTVTDDYLHVTFFCNDHVYCEYIEFDGKTDKPKLVQVKR